MEYEKQILKPIVTIARLIYTPDIYDYELCHISRHLPKNIVEEITQLYKVSSFDDIDRNIKTVLNMLGFRIFANRWLQIFTESTKQHLCGVKSPALRTKLLPRLLIL